MKKIFLAAITSLALCSYSYAQDDEDEYEEEDSTESVAPAPAVEEEEEEAPAPVKKEKKKDIKETLIRKKNDTPLDPDDEDATIACLVAAIECRNETKKNVRIVSVREVR